MKDSKGDMDKYEKIEVDILAFAGDKAFAGGVESSPNKQEYVQEFIDKLQALPLLIPQINRP